MNMLAKLNSMCFNIFNGIINPVCKAQLAAKDKGKTKGDLLVHVHILGEP